VAIDDLNNRCFCDEEQSRVQGKRENEKGDCLRELETDKGDQLRGVRESCSVEQTVQPVVYDWKERRRGGNKKQMCEES